MRGVLLPLLGIVVVAVHAGPVSHAPGACSRCLRLRGAGSAFMPQSQYPVQQQARRSAVDTLRPEEHKPVLKRDQSRLILSEDNQVGYLSPIPLAIRRQPRALLLLVPNHWHCLRQDVLTHSARRFRNLRMRLRWRGRCLFSSTGKRCCLHTIEMLLPALFGTKWEQGEKLVQNI